MRAEFQNSSTSTMHLHVGQRFGHVGTGVPLITFQCWHGHLHDLCSSVTSYGLRYIHEGGRPSSAESIHARRDNVKEVLVNFYDLLDMHEVALDVLAALEDFNHAKPGLN